MTKKILSLRGVGLTLVLAGLLLVLIIGTALAATVTLLNDGFENTPYVNWDDTPSNWLQSSSNYHSGLHAAYAQSTSSSEDHGTLTSDDLDASDATSITVDFWFRHRRTEATDYTLYYYNGTSYILIAELDGLGADGDWLHYTDTIVDSQYFVSDFRIQLDATLEVDSGGSGGEYVYVDDVLITKEDEPTNLLVDYEFDDSSDSADLRTNSTEQDWYESRNGAPLKLTLDTSDIGGNTGNKAALKYSDPTGSGYAYVTQNFGSPQSGTFSVSLDIYIDSIAEDADRDRSGMIYIGDDSGGTSGPNSGSAERFVFLAFYDESPSPGLDTDLILKARECDASGHVSVYCNTRDQSWDTTSAWTTITSGLSEDTWYTIRLFVDVASETYDVYVDDVLMGNDVNAYEDYPSSSVTHISFSTGSAAQGDFYVDKVQEAGEMQCFSTTGTYTFNTQPGVEIEVTGLGSGGTELGCLYVDEVPANHPNATGTEGTSGIMTGKYWTIHGLQSDGDTPATGYILNLTLPHSVTPVANAYVCKYPGSQGGYGWDCARTDADASTVWLNGITSLSDWAVGDYVGPTTIGLQNLTANSTSSSGNLIALTELALLGLVVVLSIGLVVVRKHRA